MDAGAGTPNGMGAGHALDLAALAAAAQPSAGAAEMAALAALAAGVGSARGQASPSEGSGGKKPKLPRPTEHVNCPRCGGGDTKFCYFNNYNASQPRYYCKVRRASRRQLFRQLPFVVDSDVVASSDCLVHYYVNFVCFKGFFTVADWRVLFPCHLSQPAWTVALSKSIELPAVCCT